ncbi:tRNA epoxyqueuosine(34) reductase QueG [Flavobacterium branchiophilum]|uniref:Epoxyqueuosine reductase n=1 Tax=Flavobacterium branchiophilum (strain FL-15) TaxID=1034807 RepID=G2Z4J9_FLABF|nr:tRNA epoxyqueuosine(34) reductase QueG [Flavobacterium branchiophilum]CCB68474.1 Putative 4Fe-4S binding protein [Flavobacterium branchiophilum FL-15]
MKSTYTAFIKSEALKLGFFSVGISKAAFLEEEAPRLELWLEKNHQGQMSYMERHFDKRLDPTILVPDAKSVISLLFNYYPSEKQIENTYKISKYAYGQDYHDVIRDKLKILMQAIQDQIGQVSGRVFVDSAPVLDKAWAKKSGLGWIGKNSNLITKKAGSFFFIAEIILDLELDYDTITTDHCGTCTACIDACPTQAIVAPYQVDGSKCISYFTIELKEQLPNELKQTFDDWVFGCDVCQDVCPWNRFSKPHQEPLFSAKTEIINNTKADWEFLSDESFNEIFKNSPIKRINYHKFFNNLLK